MKNPEYSGLRGQRLGLLLMLLSCALLSAHDAATKLLTERYPVSQIIFLRGVIAALGVMLIEVGRSNAAALMPKDVKGQLARAGLFAASTVLITVSLKLLPLPIVTAIIFVSPIMVAVLSGPLLNERVGSSAWIAAFAGFAGVVLIVSPAGTAWSWAFLVPLASAAASALRDIVTRHLAVRESTSSIVLSTTLAAALVGLLGLPQSEWHWPDLTDTALLVFVGATQLTAHYMQVEAFRLAAPSVLAALKYSMVLWALILGVLIWGDTPSAGVLMGAALIISAGLLVYRRA